MGELETIVIQGARQHNLKNLTLEIPRNKFVVITGVSGSGKSTLAFDVLYAEGRRRYVESLSAAVRQFLTQYARPEVDAITGLAPAVAVEQRGAVTSPRSTVGTVSEISDYLRILYARVGESFCLDCGQRMRRHSIPEIVDDLLKLPESSRLQILAPVRLRDLSEFEPALQTLREAGFARVRVSDVNYDLAEAVPPPPMEGTGSGEISVVVDRIIVKEGIAGRLSESVETAARCGRDVVRALVGNKALQTFTLRLICPTCEFSYPEIDTSFFSPNTPKGACQSCQGLGCIEAKRNVRTSSSGSRTLMRKILCEACDGTGLRHEVQGIQINGKSITQLNDCSIGSALEFLSAITLDKRGSQIGEVPLLEIVRRMTALVDMGLEYLKLNRSMMSLSGGESQRIRLAGLLGNGLSGVVYVLDEPSVGLHPRDTHRLIGVCRRLRDQGNTVVVVEHDADTMRAADYIIDLGPGAGERGGQICAIGTPEEIKKCSTSLTGKYLARELRIDLRQRTGRFADFLTLSNVRVHNLKSISLKIPLRAMTCITGVSGSGKSSLVMNALIPLLNSALGDADQRESRTGEISGWERIESLVVVDQTPVGRSPSSTPATYVGVMNPIRDLFSKLPDARVRGYGRDRFSFNAKGGRCEVCEGYGVKAVKMNFLPDVYLKCGVCEGRRYNRETLSVSFRGKNIADVLEMTVTEALELFSDIPKARPRLELLRDIGLGYLRLGQAAPTLSGGEAQRLKLAKELGGRKTGNTLFIFDEPTTGLHLADIRLLSKVMGLLVDSGNTVLVVEHHLDLIKTADWIVDLGPEGGDAGGEVVAMGQPPTIMATSKSHTGRFMAATEE